MEEGDEVWFRNGQGWRMGTRSCSGTDKDGRRGRSLVQERTRMEEGNEVWFRSGPGGRKGRRSGSGADQEGGGGLVRVDGSVDQLLL